MSFRRRLAQSLVLFGTAILFLPAFVFYRQVESVLYQHLDDALRSVARAELASAIDDPDEPPHVHDLESGIELQSGLEEIAWIVDSKGKVVTATPGVDWKELEDLTVGIPAGRELFNRSIHGQSFRLLVTSLTHRGENFTEVLGLSREPSIRRLKDLRNQMLLILAFWVAILSASSVYLARKLTAPLSKLAKDVEALGRTGAAGMPPYPEPLDKELRVLHVSIDNLWKRINKLMTAQKSFVSDASHEMRAPLTNMNVALEVCLRKPRESEEYREVLEVCHQEVQRLSGLAERLLTLSRLDSDQHSLRWADVELEELTRQSVEFFRARAEQSGHPIVFEPGGALNLRCDPGAYRQILDNLLDNAIRHAPPGTEVTVRLEKRDSVRLEVKNRLASPLPVEVKQRIFERFYRGDSSRNRETGGAGLGLAIVAALAQAHEGSYGVQDGAEWVTFWVELPVREAA